jgi:hypothetical protein
MTISVSISLLSIAESKLIATIEEHNMEYLQEIVSERRFFHIKTGFNVTFYLFLFSSCLSSKIVIIIFETKSVATSEDLSPERSSPKKKYK